MPHQPYNVTLPDWEGPLDLLLHVIRTHELDILDIPISFITDQYLKYLDLMQSLNLDVASEYLEMAATLAYIKSRSLLPKEEQVDDEEEEEEDPREELIRRLLEYQRYKDAAQQLGTRPLLGKDTFSAAHSLADSSEEPLIELGVFELVNAFRKILERSKLDLSHEVTTERITVSERIAEIVSLLRPGERVPIEFLAGENLTRLRLVVTLLALLEMCRLRMIRLTQARGGGPLYAALRGPAEGLEQQSLDRPDPSVGVMVKDPLKSRRSTPKSRTLQLLARSRRLRRRDGKTRLSPWRILKSSSNHQLAPRRTRGRRS